MPRLVTCYTGPISLCQQDGVRIGAERLMAYDLKLILEAELSLRWLLEEEDN